jgi:transcriptional regulator with XRE-family HTH domain
VDDLDRSIARRTAKNPRYPEMLQAEIRRQRLIAALIAERKANHLTQAQVAAEMNVSQSVVAEVESSKADVRYSTLDRYAEAVTKHKKRLDLTPGALVKKCVNALPDHDDDQAADTSCLGT